MKGVVAGGPAVVGDSLYAVAGIREPGVEGREREQRRLPLRPRRIRRRRRIGPSAAGRPPLPDSSTTAPGPPTWCSSRPHQTCVGSPCDLFDCAASRCDRHPTGLQPTPSWRSTPPVPGHHQRHRPGAADQWLQPGSPAAAAGATVFGLFISESDDNPVGGVLCILDASGSCTTDSSASPDPVQPHHPDRPRRTRRPVPDGLGRPGPPHATTSFTPPLTPVGASDPRPSPPSPPRAPTPPPLPRRPCLLLAMAADAGGVQLVERRRTAARPPRHDRTTGPPERRPLRSCSTARATTSTRTTRCRRSPPAGDPTIADDPNGLDINAQICFFPDGSDRFVAGEDTGQTTGRTQGWGIFQLSGQAIGDSGPTEVGKLVPTFQGSEDNAENYGCGFLADGRIVTTDVGNQADGAGRRPADRVVPAVRQRSRSRYCKVDVAIATAQSIWVDDQDRVYVASARPPAFGGQTSGVWRYSGPARPAPTPAGGCGQTDGTGAPLVDAFHKEIFIAARSRTTCLTPERHRRVARRPPLRVQRHQRRASTSTTPTARSCARSCSRLPARASGRSRSPPAPRSASGSAPTARSTTPTSAS